MNTSQYITSANAAYDKLVGIINSDAFMSGLTFHPSESEIISDIDKVVYYSTEQDAQDDGVGIFCWTEILEGNTNIYNFTEIKSELSDSGVLLTRHTSNLGINLSKEISENKRICNLPYEAQGVISENFNTFFLEFSFFERLHSFNQQMLYIYINGGFPCGWRGGFPDGK